MAAGFDAWLWRLVMIANYTFAGGAAWQARNLEHLGRRTALQAAKPVGNVFQKTSAAIDEVGHDPGEDHLEARQHQDRGEDQGLNMQRMVVCKEEKIDKAQTQQNPEGHDQAPQNGENLHSSIG